jgi:hypothetical protein
MDIRMPILIGYPSSIRRAITGGDATQTVKKYSAYGGKCEEAEITDMIQSHHK